jgi:methyl-accepting chemotaxis protein
MLAALRRLAAALRDASHDAAALATRITASAAAVARQAGETAHTSEALSRQSAEMAATIDALAADANRLTDIAGEVAMGAHEVVARHRQLGALTAASRERLDDGARALSRLGADVRESAGAVEALAEASEEIRSFVALVQRVARQSRFLAINAAVEASRGGEGGSGFAAVAGEVHRLAADSAGAAARTETAVAAILDRVERSRALAARTVLTVDAVLEATRAGEQAAEAVEHAVAASAEWTGSVEHAAAQSSRLVQDMTGRLDVLAGGTQGFATAMREVAATSEEQSAGTQRIASAAASLADASSHLASLVGTFRLTEAVANEGRGAGGAAASSVAPCGRPRAALATLPR